MKMKLLLASLMLTLAAMFMTPTGLQAAPRADGFAQTSEQATPLEMRGHRGWRGHRRHWGFRPVYRPYRVYRPARIYYAPRPAYCRTVVRYNRWGQPRYRRICR